ncbi:MAG: tetratricopeptide repeat protein [Planctomycetes bacterium]|nr:tetratricopeptide repeat protein [Planctomycetota bacterium]
MCRTNLFVFFASLCLVFLLTGGESFAEEGEIWSQTDVAVTNIDTGNELAAQAAVNTLVADFSEDVDYGKALYKVAGKYKKLNKHEKSDKLYEKIIQKHPDSYEAMRSYSQLAISKIRVNKDSEAEPIVDKLFLDFSDQEHAPIVVCEIADKYKKQNKNAEAKELYQRIIGTWPGSEHAMWSQMHLAISAINEADQSTADAEVSKLLNELEFRWDQHRSSAVYSVAEEYRKLGKFGKAVGVYQNIVENWSETKYGLWSQMGLAMCNIETGDEAGVEAAVDRMIVDYTNDDHLAVAICNVVEGYCEKGKQDKAAEIYQLAVNNWPQQEQAVWAEMIDVISNIHLGNENEANAGIDRLTLNFSGQLNLTRAVYMIAEQYHRKGSAAEESGLNERSESLYQKAVSLWEMIINDFDECFLTVESCAFVAKCHRKLGDYEESIQYYQKIIDEYPDYRHGWYALYMVGHNLETLLKTGSVSSAVAVPQIQAVYTQLIEKYPTCSAADGVQSWLNNHN